MDGYHGVLSGLCGSRENTAPILAGADDAEWRNHGRSSHGGYCCGFIVDLGGAGLAETRCRPGEERANIVPAITVMVLVDYKFRDCADAGIVQFLDRYALWAAPGYRSAWSPADNVNSLIGGFNEMTQPAPAPCA